MRKFSIAIATLACVFSASAHALPTLQAHLVDSTAGDRSGDQDTWFNTSYGPGVQRLELIASYGVNSKITNISDGYLVLTVAPHDADSAAPNFRFFYEYLSGILAEIANVRDYRYEDEAAFEDALGTRFKNHAPYGMPSSQVDVYGIPLNMILAGLGDFNDLSYESASSGFSPSIHRDYHLKDCNADTPGTTGCEIVTQAGLLGETKTIGFSTENANFVHVDFVAKVTESSGKTTTDSWEINPASHDSTISVPEPGSLALLATGMLLLTAGRRLRGRQVMFFRRC